MGREQLFIVKHKKTQAIIFGSCTMPESFKDLDIPNITVNNKGDRVPFLNEVADLGVILDNTLSWRS